MPHGVRAGIDELGGLWPTLVYAPRALSGVAHVTSSSASAGLYRTDTGAELPGSSGLHVFVLVQNGMDSERFLKTLHLRCWLAGLGWMMVGAVGRRRDRGRRPAQAHVAHHPGAHRLVGRLPLGSRRRGRYGWANALPRPSAPGRVRHVSEAFDLSVVWLTEVAALMFPAAGLPTPLTTASSISSLDTRSKYPATIGCQYFIMSSLSASAS